MLDISVGVPVLSVAVGVVQETDTLSEFGRSAPRMREGQFEITGGGFITPYQTKGKKEKRMIPCDINQHNDVILEQRILTQCDNV